MPRVITGKAKNIKLINPSNTRVLTDRVKTTIFDLLQEIIKNSKILDLYAGSGAFGIEALSRGAKYAEFIEKTPENCSIIKKNLKKCKITKNLYKIICKQLPDILLNTKEKSQFDIIFCDPPFQDLKKIENHKTIQRIIKALINTKNIFILKYPTYKEIPNLLPQTKLEYKKTIGKNTIYFIKKRI